MPYVNVKMYPGRSEEQKREVARRIVDALVEVCNVADPAACAVVIEEVSPELYKANVVPEIEAKKAQHYSP